MGNLLAKQDNVLSNPPNYRGTWQSSVYPNVCGEMYVHIPENIDNDFKSEALIKYDKGSSYRAGCDLKMKINGSINNSSSTGKTTVKSNYITKSLMIIATNQDISYYVNDIGDMLTLNGTYVSTNPKDSGAFILKKIII